MGEKVGSVAPAQDGGLLVAGERHVHVLDAAGVQTARIRVLDDQVDSRLNDGTCDPAGRFLVGSVRLDTRERRESLVSVGPDRDVRVIVEGISVSNGIGFSPDSRTMYYVESRPGTVLAFDYDLGNGTVSGQRVVAATGGTPDGLAVDVHGNLWVAFFGEARVRCLSPAGDVLREVHLPVPNATCPEFAGPDLDRLIVTTARFRMDAASRERWPASGGVFVAEPGVAGLPATRWAGSTR